MSPTRICSAVTIVLLVLAVSGQAAAYVVTINNYQITHFDAPGFPGGTQAGFYNDPSLRGSSSANLTASLYSGSHQPSSSDPSLNYLELKAVSPYPSAGSSAWCLPCWWTLSDYYWRVDQFDWTASWSALLPARLELVTLNDLEPGWHSLWSMALPPGGSSGHISNIYFSGKGAQFRLTVLAPEPSGLLILPSGLAFVALQIRRRAATS